jgi:hypothetical protein
MLDIVTVVFQDELETLKIQARSIELYCQNIGMRSIYVMVNDSSLVDPAWYGAFADRVRIIPRSTYGCQWSEYGWVSQQVLKIYGAALSSNTWSMIVDAKTFFIQPLSIDQIFKNHCPQVGKLAIYPVFEASRAITNKLFGINLQQQLGPGGVPFIMHNATVRSMIAEVERRSGQHFADYFQQQGRLTEFILYSGYLEYQYGGFDTLYLPEYKLLNTNVCHSEVSLFDQKLQQMHQPNMLSVSVHRNAWSKLSKDQQQQYHKLLSQRGIL